MVHSHFLVGGLKEARVCFEGARLRTAEVGVPDPTRHHVRDEGNPHRLQLALAVILMVGKNSGGGHY